MNSLLSKLILCAYIVSLSFTITFGQHSYYPRDTTYSIASAYQEAKTYLPDIKPHWPELPAKVSAHYNLVYAQLDRGRKLHLDLFRPKRKKRKLLPAVLIIHGGGWRVGSKENMVPMAQQLAKKGYVTIAVEYRLSTEAPYPASVHDLKTAIRWIRAHADTYGIDPDKVVACGTSAGAMLATLLGTTNELTLYDQHPDHASYSAKVNAILNIDGITSFVHPEAAPEWTGKSAPIWLGTYAENLPRWTEASALEYVGATTPPTLFINSSYPRFHAGRDDYRQLLDQHEIYSEAHTFADSPHGFWFYDPWFNPMLKIMHRFLKKIF